MAEESFDQKLREGEGDCEDIEDDTDYNLPAIVNGFANGLT